MYVPNDVKKKVKEFFGKGYTIEILPLFRITNKGRSEQFDVCIEDKNNNGFFYHPFPDDPQFSGDLSEIINIEEVKEGEYSGK